MKIHKITLLIFAFSVLLSACVVTSNSTSIKQVKETKLADGTVTRVGFKPVDDSWRCKVLDQQTSNVALNKIKGIAKISGGFDVMEQAAIDYANQRSLKPNYIYMYIPTEVAVGIIDTSMFSDAKTIYYQCDTLPGIADDISSLVK